MMKNTNIYVVMSAIFLSIIIMGGVSMYAPKPLEISEKVQGTNLLTTDPSLISGYDSSKLDPRVILNGDPTLIMENTTPRTMTLSGIGKVTIKANQAIIVLGVYTESKLADYAVKENALEMTDVINNIKSLGIPESDIQTLSYYINPMYNWEYRTTIGYQVTNTIQITVNDLTKIGAIIDKASVAGANVINSVTFTVKDEDFAKFKLQAYKKAVEDVKSKATAITEGFGIELGSIQSISESYYYPVYRNTYTAMDMKGAEAQTTIVAGNLEISVTLNVVYNLA